MDADFSDKVKSVLSDPEALAKITAMANSLTDKRNSAEPESNSAENTLSAVSSVRSLPTVDPRVNLLEALKPLVREEKRPLVEGLSTALTAFSLIKSVRK